MDYLSIIRQPIVSELNDFNALFEQALSEVDNDMLENVLGYIKKRGGKRMRPILTLLMAKSFGQVSDSTQHAALALELLHTASLVHDDVVDESDERRGQASVNASFTNKVAVLVGDYILSTALLHVAYTGQPKIVEELAQLGRTLASGELLQLSSVQKQEISEDLYFDIIYQKTAVLFAVSAAFGAMSAGAHEGDIEGARQFGKQLGLMFQIRDDIFDYFDDASIGKPTGNDMKEGKLTLPVIYALNKSQDADMIALAYKVKEGSANTDEIARLVDFTKLQGGIEYAEHCMDNLGSLCKQYIDEYIKEKAIRDSLTAYVDYVVQRSY
jgi:octaprenyl-diphosphate synthase